ncbi:Peptidase inhibitor 16 [Bulinus truncatus]|nr:Peptidase inhibitor 16 [Bulinus truncatus]
MVNAVHSDDQDHLETLAIQTFLEYHNQYRDEVGVPKLSWSDELMIKSKAHVAACSFNHTGPGENLYAGGPFILDNVKIAKWAVKQWYAEKSAVDKDWFCAWKTGQCGHYSQVII